MERYRVGIGYDSHRLVTGRKLILGGIEIPHTHGLLGHSDADVVLHAVCDALLGAAGLPDIGEFFPDTDARYKDADSRGLLTEACGMVRERGFNIGNLDVIVHADSPKLGSHKRTIAQSVAGLLGIGDDRVSVKAKTLEGLGSHDAIACTCVVLLERNKSTIPNHHDH